MLAATATPCWRCACPAPPLPSVPVGPSSWDITYSRPTSIRTCRNNTGSHRETCKRSGCVRAPTDSAPPWWHNTTSSYQMSRSVLKWLFDGRRAAKTLIPCYRKYFAFLDWFVLYVMPKIFRDGNPLGNFSTDTWSHIFMHAWKVKTGDLMDFWKFNFI